MSMCFERDVMALTGTDDLGEALAAIERRLMPAGMEWPKFEDGSEVEFEDDVQTYRGVACVVSMRVRLNAFVLGMKQGDEFFSVFADKPLKRPPVLAADGKPIEAGETLYGGDGLAWEVLCIDCKSSHPVHGLCRSPLAIRQLRTEWLTHEPPELPLADGRPALPGETVWRGDGTELTVLRISKKGDRVVCRDAGGKKRSPLRGELSHEEPDIWERLLADEKRGTMAYWGCESCERCSDCPAKVDGKSPRERYAVENCLAAKTHDMFSRAKKLAGVE